MDDVTYSVLVVDGDIMDLSEPFTSTIRFNGMTHDEAITLVERSILEGYIACLWTEREAE